jgi:hypothetical protein
VENFSPQELPSNALRDIVTQQHIKELVLNAEDPGLEVCNEAIRRSGDQ